jgi:hypothetical protein
LNKEDYIFTSNWCIDNKFFWNLHLNEYKDKKNISLLEIGLYEGRSTLWFLRNITTHKTSTITGIDINISDNFKHNFSIFNTENKINIYKEASYDFLKKNNENFDIIYIDGSHKGKNVLEDIVLSWRNLKMNGTMVLDDYKMYDKRYPEINLPKKAIDTFLSLYRDELIIVHKEYQVIVKKKFRELDEYSIRLNEELYIYIDLYGDKKNKESALFKWIDSTRYEVVETEQEKVSLIIETLTINKYEDKHLKIIEEFKLQQILGL